MRLNVSRYLEDLAQEHGLDSFMGCVVLPQEPVHAVMSIRTPYLGTPEVTRALVRVQAEIPSTWRVEIRHELTSSIPVLEQTGEVGDLARELAPKLFYQATDERRADLYGAFIDVEAQVLLVLGGDLDWAERATKTCGGMLGWVARKLTWEEYYALPSTTYCVFSFGALSQIARAKEDAEWIGRLEVALVGLHQINARLAAAAQRKLAPPVTPAPAPAPRDIDDRYRPCRWCGDPIPASDNPKSTGACPSCGAQMSATAIPTKNPLMPLLQVWMNPDGSAYVEFVFAPPNGDLRLSKVTRYVVPAAMAQVFAQNPMGLSPHCLGEDS